MKITQQRRHMKTVSTATSLARKRPLASDEITIMRAMESRTPSSRSETAKTATLPRMNPSTPQLTPSREPSP